MVGVYAMLENGGHDSGVENIERGSVMGKIHFWLIGFGVAWLTGVFFFDAPMGFFAIGIPIGAIGLGIRQWFMADAYAEQRGGAFSNTGVGGSYDKNHYHELD